MNIRRTITSRPAGMALAALLLAAAPLLATAQSTRASQVAAPAVVTADASAALAAANSTRATTAPEPAASPSLSTCTPVPGYTCIPPTPLPPGAGNSCFRGNSAGVSRCPR